MEQGIQGQAQPSAQQQQGANQHEQSGAELQGGEVLSLPAPGGASGTVKLDVSTGETVAMDHLGPLVVGPDGQLSRIANWDAMTEREREVTRRRVCARNRERLAKLRQEPAAQEQQ